MVPTFQPHFLATPCYIFQPCPTQIFQPDLPTTLPRRAPKLIFPATPQTLPYNIYGSNYHIKYFKKKHIATKFLWVKLLYKSHKKQHTSPQNIPDSNFPSEKQFFFIQESSGRQSFEFRKPGIHVTPRLSLELRKLSFIPWIRPASVRVRSLCPPDPVQKYHLHRDWVGEVLIPNSKFKNQQGYKIATGT